MNLSCGACRGELPALSGPELLKHQRDLEAGWHVANEHQLEKDYGFPDFGQAMTFAVRVGELAESEGHHPEICVGWGRVRLTLYTHKVDGLTETDFVLAAKIDRLHAAEAMASTHPTD
jgi:4a-hydroxytetrahydrobiopterin dehydratase